MRVAVDGPPCADPGAFADALREPLRVLGRPFAHVRAKDFLRDASVRFEHGHEDVESYANWLDHGAVQREVLVAAVERGEYLPTLRDPVTDRSTRAAPVAVQPGTVLAVSGPLLLGLGLTFDLVVHLALSPAARTRRTPADEAWTLPAYDEYDEQVRPAQLADVVVKLDDPRRPAVSGLQH
ncbi:uridine kinase [Jatrophihabitans fulvus]